MDLLKFCCIFWSSAESFEVLLDLLEFYWISGHSGKWVFSVANFFHWLFSWSSLWTRIPIFLCGYRECWIELFCSCWISGQVGLLSFLNIESRQSMVEEIHSPVVTGKVSITLRSKKLNPKSKTLKTWQKGVQGACEFIMHSHKILDYGDAKPH